MKVKNITTNFDLTGELIDSVNLTYLKIKFDNGKTKYELIDHYRDIEYLEESLEQFRKRVLCAYEVSNALYEIAEQEELPPWERPEDWWKK